MNTIGSVLMCQTYQQVRISFTINLLFQKSINKVPKRITLRLRRICNSDEKCDIRSSEYQNYLIKRDCNP